MAVLSSCQEGTCQTGVVLTPEEQAADDTTVSRVSRAACPELVPEL